MLNYFVVDMFDFSYLVDCPYSLNRSQFCHISRYIYRVGCFGRNNDLFGSLFTLKIFHKIRISPLDSKYDPFHPFRTPILKKNTIILTLLCVEYLGIFVLCFQNKLFVWNFEDLLKYGSFFCLLFIWNVDSGWFDEGKSFSDLKRTDQFNKLYL